MLGVGIGGGAVWAATTFHRTAPVKVVWAASFRITSVGCPGGQYQYVLNMQWARTATIVSPTCNAPVFTVAAGPVFRLQVVLNLAGAIPPGNAAAVESVAATQNIVQGKMNFSVNQSIDHVNCYPNGVDPSNNELVIVCTTDGLTAQEIADVAASADNFSGPVMIESFGLK